MINKTIYKMAFLFILLSVSLLAGTTGKASWYGKKFQGKLTANGERYNMYAYTAAHRTYAFGTILKVTNKATGKSIKVRVNDRGPYCNARIIDLSYNAAKKLGFVKKGIATVVIEKVKPLKIKKKKKTLKKKVFKQKSKAKPREKFVAVSPCMKIIQQPEVQTQREVRTQSLSIKEIEEYLSEKDQIIYKIILLCNSLDMGNEIGVTKQHNKMN